MIRAFLIAVVLCLALPASAQIRTDTGKFVSTGTATPAQLVGNGAATGIGTILDNHTLMTGGKAVSVRTNATEIASISYTGAFSSAAGAFTSTGTATSATITGKPAATSDVAVVLNGSVTQTSGKLLSVKNNGTEKANIDYTGLATVVGLTSTGVTTSAGYLASGAVDVDFSGSTGAFKTSTGAGTIGGTTSTVTVTAPMLTSNAKNKGTCTLGTNCGSITVLAGAACWCNDQTTAAACKAVVSSTTLTITGTSTDAMVWGCQ
jgi:hypothetical protein